MDRLYDQLKMQANQFLSDANTKFKQPFKVSDKLRPSERFLSHWLIARRIPSKQVQAGLQLIQHSKRLGPWQYQFAQLVEKEGWISNEELARSENQIHTQYENIPMLVIHICDCWRLVKSPERLIKDLHAAAAENAQSLNATGAEGEDQVSHGQIVADTLKQRLLKMNLHLKKVDYVFKMAHDLSKEVAEKVNGVNEKNA